MTRVIHTGDTHIGYRQYHSPERRQDFLDAFEAVIDDAIDDGVDAVIHAGDLFHDRRPELHDLLGTLSILRRLDDAGIPFLAVVGNHESTRSGQWLDLFERLGLATRLGAEPIELGEVAFYGLDHVPESRRDELTYQFDPSGAAHDVLVSHGLFTPFAHANWNTEHVLEASTVPFDAVLLGDNHAPGVETVDDTWVTYCGSTERASASERDPRGYNLIEFGDRIDIRRRSIDTRPFVFIDVELGECEGPAVVRERLRQHDATDAVVIVKLTGEGEPVTPAEIEAEAIDRGALVARVSDDRNKGANAAADLGVEFADPDAAVDEAIADMGLSTAGEAIDELVRTETIADTNIRERTKQHVSELLEEGFEAFEPVVGDDQEPQPKTDDQESQSENNDRESKPNAEPESTTTDSSGAETGVKSPTGETEASAESTSEEPEQGGDRETPKQNVDGQASMGEYL
ncbi:DNA double-strand break repair protein Mre11 [Halalkalirubrum salinum]|uniref:DNA double-strand break repair protein Mre11 n=1 Tax=Halalkalirubrum salinum TaxID=2563889 RepID=UPI0010FB572A|nr:DNA double-strand break repair protein Mre11 [Halalkalirubrum salinum]